MSSVESNASVRKYELEIAIDATKDVVWKALTTETNAWWLPDFHMVGEGSVVTFDAQAGGHLIERIEGGGSLLWYTVTLCTPGESIHLVGHVAPEWGGPMTSMLQLALQERDGQTILVVQDASFGNTSDSHAKTLEDGWRWLFTDGLKAHVESAKA